jgi:hypothetical protein
LRPLPGRDRRSLQQSGEVSPGRFPEPAPASPAECRTAEREELVDNCPGVAGGIEASRNVAVGARLISEDQGEKRNEIRRRSPLAMLEALQVAEADPGTFSRRRLREVPQCPQFTEATSEALGELLALAACDRPRPTRRIPCRDGLTRAT